MIARGAAPGRRSRLRLYPGDWRSAAGHAPIPSVSGDIEGPATQRRLPRLPRRRAGDDRFYLAAGGSPELLRAALRTAPRRRRTSSTRSRRSTSPPVAGSGPFPLIHGFRTSALVRQIGFVGRRAPGRPRLLSDFVVLERAPGRLRANLGPWHLRGRCTRVRQT